MSAKTHGTVYVWGVDTTNPTSAQIVSVRKATQAEINAFVLNSSGARVHQRVDDLNDIITITLRIESGYTRLVVGNKTTVAGGAMAGDYIVTGTDENKQVKDFDEYTITGEKGEYMTYS